MAATGASSGSRGDAHAHARGTFHGVAGGRCTQAVGQTPVSGMSQSGTTAGLIPPPARSREHTLGEGTIQSIPFPSPL